jgi:hypothetical protein
LLAVGVAGGWGIGTVQLSLFAETTLGGIFVALLVLTESTTRYYQRSDAMSSLVTGSHATRRYETETDHVECECTDLDMSSFTLETSLPGLGVTATGGHEGVRA